MTTCHILYFLVHQVECYFIFYHLQGMMVRWSSEVDYQPIYFSLLGLDASAMFYVLSHTLEGYVLHFCLLDDDSLQLGGLFHVMEKREQDCLFTGT
jgi:hypothetical protein